MHTTEQLSAARANVRISPTFVVERRTPLFADGFATTVSPHANFDVSLDGTRFLMVRSVKEQTELFVVHGWRTELKARLAGRQ